MASAYHSPEELLAAAKLGIKLKPKQRLAVVIWLETSGEIENYPDPLLAKAFGCRPAAIKRYRKLAREEFAKAISAEQAMNYMADFVRSYDFLIREAKEALKGNKNTGLHQGYMRLLKEIEAEKIEKLQSVGVIPKELGRLTTATEEWTAVVSEDGVASVSNTSEASDDESS